MGGRYHKIPLLPEGNKFLVRGLKTFRLQKTLWSKGMATNKILLIRWENPKFVRGERGTPFFTACFLSKKSYFWIKAGYRRIQLKLKKVYICCERKSIEIIFKWKYKIESLKKIIGHGHFANAKPYYIIVARLNANGLKN